MVLREFDETTIPLVFTWALKDYDALVKNLARGASESTSVSSWDIMLKQSLLLEKKTRVHIKHEMGDC